MNASKIEFGIDTLKEKMGLSTADAMTVIRILVESKLDEHDTLQGVSDYLTGTSGRGVEWYIYRVEHGLTHKPIKTMEDNEIIDYYIEPDERDQHSIIITHDGRTICDVPARRDKEMRFMPGVLQLDTRVILSSAFEMVGNDHLVCVTDDEGYIFAELYTNGRMTMYADISKMSRYEENPNGVELLTIGAMTAIAGMMTDTHLSTRERLLGLVRAMTTSLINKGAS